MSHNYLSWNRLPKISAENYYTVRTPHIPTADKAPRPLLNYGNGRSYGDVCLNDKGSILLTKSFNKLISFDRKNGILRAYSGILLQDILNLIIPCGWFLATTPGTALITLGGAVANDVHGKNHHIAGTFGHHVRELVVIRSDGKRYTCNRKDNAALFSATIGGLGLTGMITEIEIALTPIHNHLIWCENRRFKNIDHYFELNNILQPKWPCAASWIDCFSGGKSTGRGVMFLGKHAPSLETLSNKGKINLSCPIELPFSLINNLSVTAFNALFYQTHPDNVFHSHYQPFFYPLDSVLNWNRIYGKKGFYQYQCVIPPENEQEGIKALLEVIRKSKQGSALVVLKTFGNIPPIGMLSFPRAGTTLALDFPNKGKVTDDLLVELDRITLEAGGALYPAKDARMSAEMFYHSFPRLEEFKKFIDPQFSSAFWERMHA